jgi:hypothetical protein
LIEKQLELRLVQPLVKPLVKPLKRVVKQFAEQLVKHSISRSLPEAPPRQDRDAASIPGAVARALVAARMESTQAHDFAASPLIARSLESE